MKLMTILYLICLSLIHRITCDPPWMKFIPKGVGGSGDYPWDKYWGPGRGGNQPWDKYWGPGRGGNHPWDKFWGSGSSSHHFSESSGSSSYQGQFSDSIHGNPQLKMVYGYGGTTVVKYADHKDIFLVNGTRYYCKGKIKSSGKSVKCDGEQSDHMPRFQFYCSQMPFIIIRKPFGKLSACFKTTFSAENVASITCRDGKCKCLESDITLKNMKTIKDLCGPNYGKDGYLRNTYYPSESNTHTEIKSFNYNLDDALLFQLM